MARHVAGNQPLEAALMRPLIGADGPDIHTAIQALITWGNSTSNRLSMMTQSEFPLEDDLPAFLVLNQLVYRGAARPTDLANAIDTGRSNVSKIIRRLEDAGLLVRGPDPRDDRGVIVALTEEGRAVGQRLVRTLYESQSDVLLPFTAEEFADLERLILKFVRAIDALPEHPLSTVSGVRFH